MPPYQWRRLRGLLAERRITMTALAGAAGLNPVFVMRTLRGITVPGELARIKLVRGLRAVGLPEAVALVGAPFADEGVRRASAS